MTVHSSGAGSSWNETLDVDQPHGLDYQEWNDVRIGVRKRIEQEHVSFAGATAGGIHKPGGSAVLGIDDDTATVVADGTYRGHGLVWDGSVNLWCWTKTAGITDTPGVAGTEDWTILKMHPDKQWGGQDVTWAGAHEFDASVDISGNVAADGDFSVDGTIEAGSLKVVGDSSLAGELAVDGSTNLSGDVALAADLSVDGTAALQDIVLTGDSTFTFDAIAGETGPTFKIFGDWSTRAVEATYTARTDGIVVASCLDNTQAKEIIGHTPYGTQVANDEGAATVWSQITFPVKKGNTWAVRMASTADATKANSSRILWLPLGDNT